MSGLSSTSDSKVAQSFFRLAMSGARATPQERIRGIFFVSFGDFRRSSMFSTVAVIESGSFFVWFVKFRFPLRRRELIRVVRKESQREIY